MKWLFKSLLVLIVLWNVPLDVSATTQTRDWRDYLNWTIPIRCALDHLPVLIVNNNLNWYLQYTNSSTAQWNLNYTSQVFVARAWTYIAMRNSTLIGDFVPGLIDLMAKTNQEMVDYIEQHPDEFTSAFKGTRGNFLEFTEYAVENFHKNCIPSFESLNPAQELIKWIASFFD